LAPAEKKRGLRQRGKSKKNREAGDWQKKGLAAESGRKLGGCRRGKIINGRVAVGKVASLPERRGGRRGIGKSKWSRFCAREEQQRVLEWGKQG